MAGTSVEERLATVEHELAQLKQQLAADKPQATIPWWEQRFGAFANSEGYKEAERLGREYRESLRPLSDFGKVPGSQCGRLVFLTPGGLPLISSCMIFPVDLSTRQFLLILFQQVNICTTTLRYL